MDTRSSLPNYSTDAVSQATGLACADPSMTQQQFKDEADINQLVQQYGLVGTMPQNPDLPRYIDFDDIYDFQTALHAVQHAREQFLTLPSGIRSRFDHSPQQLLEFLANPANRDEAVRLGLVKASEPVPATPPATPSV